MGRVARLDGALGPLQELGAHGVLAFNFAAADKTNPAAGTKLVVTYRQQASPSGGVKGGI